MVRMSDILKSARERREGEKKKEGKPSEPERPEIVSQAPPPPPPKKGAPPFKPEPQPEQPEIKKVFAEDRKEQIPKPAMVSISSVVMKDTKPVSSDESTKIYEETVAVAKDLIKRDINPDSIDIKKIAGLVEKMVDQLSRGNKTLFMLSFNTLHQGYIPYHLVNVCIYVIELGWGLHYDRQQLIHLGTAALLHDIGLTKYLDLAYNSRRLDPKEHNEIKNHPMISSHILENVTGLNKTIVQVVYQEHERLDGTGYPRGLKEELIHTYAKIIGVADVYESMTHPRPYRNNEAIAPMDAMRELLTNKSAFDYKMVKLLIEKIGLYPIGSTVALNTKERAKVIKLNYQYPMRPVIQVMYDSEGKGLEEDKIIDLTTQYNIYIVTSKSIKEGILRY